MNYYSCNFTTQPTVLNFWISLDLTIRPGPGPSFAVFANHQQQGAGFIDWLLPVGCHIWHMRFFSSEQEMYVLTSWSFWWADPFNLHPALKRNFFYRFVCLSKQWPDLDLKPGPSRRTVFFLKPLPSNGKDMEALTVRERMEVGPMEWWWQRGDGFHFPKGMFFFLRFLMDFKDAFSEFCSVILNLNKVGKGFVLKETHDYFSLKMVL